ncbi:MAG: MFS transporter [Thermoplasmata archaeon]
MRKSIKNIYTYTFIYSFLLLNPIWVIYLLRIGYSLYYVTILDVIFYLTIVLVSLPLGRVTDRIGKKKALMISSVTTGIGIILFGIFTSFLGITLSYILWGIGVAINSSALESLTYDYSKSHNLKYLEIYGAVNFLASLSVAVASIVGGFIGQFFGLKIVIIITGLIVIMSTVNTLKIKEKVTANKATSGGIGYWKFIKERRVFSLLVIRIALILDINMMIIFKQPYYEEMGIGTAIIGIIFFIDVLLRGISSLYTQKLSFIVKDRFNSMLFFTSAIFFTIFIPGIMENYLAIFFLILNSVIFGFYSNILSEEVNVLIPTEIRATVLSVIFLISSLITAIAEPLLGYLATVKGVMYTLLIFSFAFLIMSSMAIFLYIQRKDSDGSFKLRPV